jgi:4-hydroxy-tetrahydrodipicolinate synthase
MLQGSIVALITPFLENGDVDLISFKRLIHFHIEQGTKGLVIAGTTGESPTLSSEELDLLFSIAIKEARGRILIFPAVGTYNTKESVERALRVKDLGADGCLAIFPYYSRPVFQGCLEHFRALSECNLPIVVYYHPGRTGIQFSTSQLAEICTLPNVIGLKDCSGNVPFGLDVMKRSNKSLLSGDDPLILPYMEGGAHGIIGVLGNLFPGQWNLLIEAALKGDMETAKALYEQMEPLCKAMSLETNPQCIKYAMSLKGYCSPVLRLPLILPQKETRLCIEEALELCKQVVAYA